MEELLKVLLLVWLIITGLSLAVVVDEQRAQTRALQSIQAAAAVIAVTREQPLGEPECLCP